MIDGAKDAGHHPRHDTFRSTEPRVPRGFDEPTKARRCHKRSFAGGSLKGPSQRSGELRRLGARRAFVARVDFITPPWLGFQSQTVGEYRRRLAQTPGQ